VGNEDEEEHNQHPDDSNYDTFAAFESALVCSMFSAAMQIMAVMSLSALEFIGTNVNSIVRV